MSKVRLYGDTSGFVDLKAPDVASNVTITLPNTTGPFATETYVDSVNKVKNVYVANKTAVESFTSNPLTNWGDVTDLSIALTPVSTNSKFLISTVVNIANSNATYSVWNAARVLRDSTVVSPAGYNSARYGSSTTDSNYFITPIVLSFEDAPATTSSITYKVQASQDWTSADSTTYIDRSGVSTARLGSSSLTIIEYE